MSSRAFSFGLPAVHAFFLVLGFWSQSSQAQAPEQEVSQYLDTRLNARSGVSCPSPELYSPLRPDPEGQPTVVGMALMFQDISRLSDVDQTMSADVYIAVRWRDPRLADPSRGEGSADCPDPGKQLWTPLVEPENLRSRQLFYDKRFLVDANGTVTLTRRILVEIANPLDLHDFPFDKHQFRITLWPAVSRTDEVVFHSLDSWLSINPDLSLLGWQVGAPAASVRESTRMGRGGTYSRYDVTIEFTRDWGYYALKLGVPLILIVLMAYTVYYIPPSAVAQQVGVGMTSMLTLVAYMLALGNSLPKISYLTRMDQLFVGCAVLVFLGLIKAILTTRWVQQEATHVIETVDRLGRWLYPIALLLVMLTALVL
jgi:hypothetical protein